MAGGWLARLLGRRRPPPGAAGAVAARRAALLGELDALLSREPFSAWARSGALPDYAAAHRALAAARDEIVALASEREEAALALELGLGPLLDRLLDAHLQFVKARLSFLRLLLALERDAAPAPPPREAPPAVPLARAEKALDRLPPPFAASPEEVPPLPDAARRLRAIDERIAALGLRAASEPDAADARVWHAGILEREKGLLAEWARRDAAIAAQLEAFPDAFDVVRTRLSAGRLDAGAMRAAMESVVARIEETEGFVRSFGPALDEMLRRG